MKPAIRVENLSKIYRINRNGGAGRDLREALTNLVRGPLHRLRHGAAHSMHTEEFSALKDVSFEVQPGEVLGVIGRNGAGKSTLLKILSQIMEPTSGRAEIRGRVGSLLEVGTGFHEELTGRENIFLNGSILGMSRREIERKFDEIVDFSGVEKFLDTPVKRYSSGMKVRLGFAVAAHLEPEILIIDEVLAVGDVEFQKRCLGKMRDVAEAGRTILFVSHQMNAITQLCTSALYLRDGSVALLGPTDEVADRYFNDGLESHSARDLSEWRRDERPRPFYTAVRLNDTLLPADVVLDFRAPMKITLEGDPNGETLRHFRAGVHLTTHDGIRLLTYGTPFSRLGDIHVTGPVTLECWTDVVPLIPGTYFLDVGCSDDTGQIDFLRRVARLVVQTERAAWPGLIPTYKAHGYFAADAQWTVESATAIADL